jgi:hypothetical protein
VGSLAAAALQWRCFKSIEHPHGIVLATMFPSTPRLMVLCDATAVSDPAVPHAPSSDGSKQGQHQHGIAAAGKRALSGTVKMAKLLLAPQQILSRLTHRRKSALHVIDGSRSKSIASVKVACAFLAHLCFNTLCLVRWCRFGLPVCVCMYGCMYSYQRRPPRWRGVRTALCCSCATLKETST